MKFIVSNSNLIGIIGCTWEDRPQPCSDSPCQDRPTNPGPGSCQDHVILPPIPCSGDFNPCLEDFNPHR